MSSTRKYSFVFNKIRSEDQLHIYELKEATNESLVWAQNHRFQPLDVAPEPVAGTYRQI